MARATYLTIGFVFLFLGAAGYVVPGLPGTPFLLLAAWLFSMSNDRLYRWMTTNRWFGQTVADYREGLGISRRVKVVSVTSMTIVIPMSLVFGIENWLVRATVLALGVIGVVFILTRPTRDPDPDTA